MNENERPEPIKDFHNPVFHVVVVMVCVVAAMVSAFMGATHEDNPAWLFILAFVFLLIALLSSIVHVHKTKSKALAVTVVVTAVIVGIAIGSGFN